MALVLREATAADRAAVAAVHRTAFGRADEAQLIDALVDTGDALVSLVAEVDGVTAGHVLFSKLTVTTDRGDAMAAAALAPLAVVPAFQRCGIGAALVNLGLTLIAARHVALVIVLGDPRYYARFGFSAALTATLQGPFAGPSWMALYVVPNALADRRATVRYPDAFNCLTPHAS